MFEGNWGSLARYRVGFISILVHTIIVKYVVKAFATVTVVLVHTE